MMTNIYSTMTTKNSCYLMIIAIVVLILDLGQLDNGWPGMVDISIKAVELFDHQVTNLCWGKQFTIEITVTLLTLTFDDKDNWKSRVAVKECKTIGN